jgi:ATP-dependent Clp protease ATP-binding subunit ClpC
MFGNFKEDTREVLMEAKAEMKALKHPYVGSEHLLLAILKSDNEVSNKLLEYHVSYSNFKEKIIETIGIGSEENELLLYTPLLKRVIENAIIDSKETNHGVVLIRHLFASLLEEGEGVAVRILISMGVSLDEVYEAFRSRFIKDTSFKHKKLLLDDIGVDLTKKALEGGIDPVVGREEEIKRVLEILLRRGKNNPVLVGEAGVGKTAIVEEIARRIAFGEVPFSLKGKRIISVSMSNFVAGTKYRGEFEERMSKVLKEIENADDIILFVDEIHTLVGAGGAEGAIDASNILKPALARGSVHLIGATTMDEYKKSFEKDSALERRFQKVVVNIPSLEEVNLILEKLAPIYEEYHNVVISSDVLKYIAQVSSKYIYDRFEPDRSIDVLDEVCSFVHLKETKEMKKLNGLKSKFKKLEEDKNSYVKKGDFKHALEMKTEENKVMNDINFLEISFYEHEKKSVTKEDVLEVLKSKTGFLFPSLEENVKEVKRFSKKLDDSLIGRDDIKEELIKIYRKLMSGKQDKCTSILLAGPTGVGKTYIANMLASAFGGDVIKLDMSEYTTSSSVSKIMGASPGYVGYDDYKNILERVRNHPYSTIILDGIEKAHQDVLNLFSRILEDSFITDSKGRDVYFNHTLLIMTCTTFKQDSNLGFQEKCLEFPLKDYFDDSFLNRIDSILSLSSISKKMGLSYIHRAILSLKKKYSFLHIRILKNVEEEILNRSSYKVDGYKKMDKIIQDEIEDKIMLASLEKKGEVVISTLEKKVLN